MEKKEENFVLFSENDVKISFNKSFYKREEELYKHIYGECKKNLLEKLEITTTKLMKLLDLEDIEKVIKVVKRLSEKKIGYHISKYQVIEREGEFSILSSYQVKDQKFILGITKEFVSVFKKDSFFNNNDMDIFIFLKNSNALKLYNLLKFNFSLNRTFEISLINMKKLFNMEGTYKRFFDFEKQVLVPLLKEIGKVVEKPISYKKIKAKDAKNSKVVAISIYIDDPYEVEGLKEVEKIKDILDNYNIPSKNLLRSVREYIGKKGYIYTENNLHYALDHSVKGEVEVFFGEALAFDFYKNRYKSKIERYLKRNPLLYDIQGHYETLGKFHSEIFKALTELKFYYLTLNPSFLKALASLKNRKEMEYSDAEFVMFAEFNTKGDSKINIFKNI